MFFFPLRDENPTRGNPYITWLIVGLCAMVFMWQLSLAEGGRAAILSYGVTPSALLGGEPLPHGLERIPAVWTIVTSMFMHGGFMHFAGNMLYLWIFMTMLRMPWARGGVMSRFIWSAVPPQPSPSLC